MKQTKEECVITAAMNIILHAGNARNILRDAGKRIAEGKNMDAIAQQHSACTQGADGYTA